MVCICSRQPPYLYKAFWLLICVHPCWFPVTPYSVTRSLIWNHECISKVFCKLINLCIHNGTFPLNLNKAGIIPVYKNKCSKMECGNYRPVSCISHVAKVLVRYSQHKGLAIRLKRPFIELYRPFKWRKWGFSKRCMFFDQLNVSTL